jgi:S1-C subfamily serine protease
MSPFFQSAVSNRRPFWSSLVISAMVLGACRPAVAQQDLADMIEKCEKCVVRIEVQSKAGPSLGSGFVVSPDGMLVTNVHVLAGAHEAIATFPNGKSYRLQGTYFFDRNRDICISRIDDRDLPALSLASELPRKGEKVTALGSPQGLSFSATNGIVSAIRSESEMRSDTGRTTLEGTWVQVDTPLSPGNSGGPLINSAGEVVAMSTLASAGRAQNLNFGISAADIREAMSKASKSKLIALADGVGKIEMEDARPESAAIIERSPIPTPALGEYVDYGRKNYADLEKKLRKDSAEAEKVLSEMKRGQMSPGLGSGQYATQEAGRGTRYYFPDSATKDSVVKVQQRLVDGMKKAKTGMTGTTATTGIKNDALFSLLWHFGPQLDPRNEHSIGFLAKAQVLHPFNAHDVIVVYEDVPYLLWVKSTAGLAAGQYITPGPAFVAGTETMEIPTMGTMAVTVLHSITETELREAIFGKQEGQAEGVAGTDDYRTWTDASGKFSIEALLVQSDGTNVVLKTRDGKTVTVPLSKLSADDIQHLNK